MIVAHYPALVASYAAALLGWLALSQLHWAPWPAGERVLLEHPWRSLGALVGALLGVLAVGQVFVRGWLLPENGALGPLLGSVNQFLIFLPVLALLVLRREGRASVWLAPGGVPLRLTGGVVLAIVAILTYTSLRVGNSNAVEVLRRIVSYHNLSFATQVFLEDVTIAALFIRLSAAIGAWQSVALTALLFAAGHIPAMLAQGNRATELLLLLRDAALGAAVVAVLQRSRDILWFWCVHFVLDMTQFSAITFVT